ncbi:hypothetical protein D9M71_604510 [compost metagenome]
MFFLPIEGAGTDTPLLWGKRSTAHGCGASQQPDIFFSLCLRPDAAVPDGPVNQRRQRRVARSSV